MCPENVGHIILYVVGTKRGIYIGRTLVQGAERVGQHANDFYKLSKEEIATARFFDTSGATLKEQRILEQTLMNRSGGVNVLANRRNEIKEDLWGQLGITRPR